MEPIGRLRHTEPPALCSALLFHHGLLALHNDSVRRPITWPSLSERIAKESS
jgi:hypothetical protein